MKNTENVFKETLVVQLSPLMHYDVFASCKETPLTVISANGKKIQEETGWTETTLFPNPGAHILATRFDIHKEFLGEKLAKTIVVYANKQNENIGVILFPNNNVMKYDKEDIKDILNPESLADFEKEINIRKNLYTQYLAQQPILRQKTK